MTIKILQSVLLCKYLQNKSISIDIAKKECKEILLNNMGKEQSVLAFANVSGGYEVRNDSVNDCIGPKDISYIRNTKKIIEPTTCCVFNDFIDYLSFLTIQSLNNLNLKNNRKHDYLILNSIENLDSAVNILSLYDCIYCFFNNDECGGNTKHRLVLKLGNRNVYDVSNYYKDYKSVSDFLINKFHVHHLADEQCKRGRGRR